MDNLQHCLCERNSDACFVQNVENSDIKNYFCYGCGFLSNSIMISGSQFLEEQLAVLPQLYRDLIWTDKNGQKWMPVTINIPEQGMIFMEGVDVNSIHWNAVLAKKIEKEEEHKFPIPGRKNEFYKHKMDMGTSKKFDKYDFIGALEYVGILSKDETKEAGSTKNRESGEKS